MNAAVLGSGLTAIAAIAIMATAHPAVGQESPTTRFHVTGSGGASLQEGSDGLRLGRDMAAYGLRVTAARRRGIQPWIYGGRFARPEFECVSGLECAEAGWLARAGVAVPFSDDADRSGLDLEARAGVGAGFADETSLSYLVGFSLLWHAIPRVAPLIEIRWEHILGMNLTMLGAGIRVEL